MDLLTRLYKVGETTAGLCAISCSDDAKKVIANKASAIKAFIAATGDTCFVCVTFEALRNGSEYTANMGVAPLPNSVGSAMAEIMDEIDTIGFADCTDNDAVHVVKVKTVKQARMHTDGNSVWFSCMVDNAFVESARLPFSLFGA